MVSIFTALLAMIAAVGCGLMAGLFFAFSCFVMSALDGMPPRQGVAAMQAINKAVINPWFFLVFFGTAGVCGLLLIVAILRWGDEGTFLMIAGALLYLFGGIFVTMYFNVPLNRELAKADPTSSGALEAWSRYCNNWVIWNHVRMFATLASLVAFILGIGIHG